MNRLLQGDVGQVKLRLWVLTAIGNGFQACIMTPTEICHTNTIINFYEICKLLKINIKIILDQVKLQLKKI